MKFRNIFIKTFPITGLFFILLANGQPNNSAANLNQGAVDYRSSAGGLEDVVPKTPIIRQNIIVNSTPSVNTDNATMADLLALEKACKSSDGNSCLAAGKIMMAEKPPQEIYDLSSTKRANRAIKLYEAAITANGNLEAMELVYDLYYDRNLINRQLNSYTDTDRAKELMDMMLAKNYPGGQIRQARDLMESPDSFLSVGKKKEACVTARSISNRRDITPSTKAIASDLLSGNFCPVLK